MAPEMWGIAAPEMYGIVGSEIWGIVGSEMREIMGSEIWQGNYGVGDMAGKLWGRRYGKGGVRDMGNAGLTCGSIASATDAIATSTARRTTASGWWRNDHERSKSARLWKGGGGVDRGRGGRGL